MLDAAKAFIVRTTDWSSLALPIFRRRLSAVSLMRAHRLRAGRDRAFGLRLGLEGDERLAGDIDDGLAVFVAQLVGALEAGAHLGRDMRRRLLDGLFRGRHAVQRDGIEQVRGQGQQDRDLRRRGYRGGFSLLEAGADAPAVLDGLAGVFVQAGAEPGEGLEFLELRIGELEIARHRPKGRALRLAADARHGLADIDRRQHAQFKQGRGEIDLPVGDRNQVGRNIGGDVLRLGFDDRQGGERAAAQILAQVSGPLQQPRVDIEDVAREGLAAGRPAQQQRQFAVGARMLGEVVIDDQHIAALLHEVLRDAGRGIGRDIGKASRVVAFGHHDHGVLHRAIVPQDRHGLGDGRRALTDGAIDAQDILVALIEDGVDRDGGLAGLAVAQDQFALAAPHGNERVDDLEPGLQRRRDRRAIHDRRRRAFDGPALARGHRTLAVERPAERDRRRARAVRRPRSRP